MMNKLYWLEKWKQMMCNKHQDAFIAKLAPLTVIAYLGVVIIVDTIWITI